VETFEHTIPQTLALVRRILGVPSDTNIFLAVDEIAKEPQNIDVFTTTRMLGVLAGHLDADHTWYLLHVDVQKLCTNFNRPII